MPVYFIRSQDIEGGGLKITGPLAHHLREALRCRVGERLRLVDEAQRGYLAEVVGVDRTAIKVSLIEHIQPPPFFPLPIILGQALLQADKMDWVIQKGTELGVDRVIPLLTRRTTARVRPERTQRQRDRWMRIALEAAQQSGRWTLPQIEEPQTLKEWLGTVSEEAVRLILWERQEPGAGRKVFQEPLRHRRAIVLVGPEGGFEEEEVAHASDLGFLPVSLGPRMLRAETASLAILTLVQHHWGDLG